MGTTLVDSLDTLWLMDMKTEFYEARDWVRDHLDNSAQGRDVSLFETTIRSLGGLLSAYDWSGDSAFLEKAEDLGERLAHAFATETGIPNSQINLVNHRSSNPGWTGGKTNIAEAGTLQLEFRYLAHVAGKPKYAEKADVVFNTLYKMRPDNGLYPIMLSNQRKPARLSGKVAFGAMGDSFYEYMLKLWLQSGKQEDMYREMYDESMDGLAKELVEKSKPSGLTYIKEGRSNNMDHLACFMGGLLALGAYTDPLGLDSERAQRDLRIGKALTYTCYQTYARTATGIGPEIVQFNDGYDFSAISKYYILRPETVESLFILHSLTGDPVYREWGWEIFLAIKHHCEKGVAFATIHDVTDASGPTEDKMESFFLAETLKYLYLLFDPDTDVDILNKHVFNTEAHPMKMLPLTKQKLTEYI